MLDPVIKGKANIPQHTHSIVVANHSSHLDMGLVKIALGQFDLGPAAAMSLIYFLIVLLLSWVFYTVMTKDEAQ